MDAQVASNVLPHLYYFPEGASRAGRLLESDYPSQEARPSYVASEA